MIHGRLSPVLPTQGHRTKTESEFTDIMWGEGQSTSED